MHARAEREWERKWFGIIIATAMAGTGHVASAADDYKLLFDLRVSETGGKSAEITAPGDVVLMDMFVLLRGANASKLDDRLQSGSGGFASSNGGLLGDLLALPSPAPFNAAGTDPGFQIDLDADGDLDIGSEPYPAAATYWGFRSGSTVGNMPAGGFYVGQVQFTVKSVAGNSTQIGFFLQQESRYSAFFRIDNVTRHGDDPGVQIGEPVTIAYSGPPVVPPGETQYLSGVIDQHVAVQGTVKPAPGAVLTLSRGLDVAASGVFDAPGPHEIHVEDATSANAGGLLRVGRMSIGQTGLGVFTQSGGFTQIDNDISLGQDRNSDGTLRVTGGTMTAGSMRVGEYGAGRFIQSGGHSTIAHLDVGLYENAAAVVEVDGDGRLSVVEETRVGVFGPGLFRQKGGLASLGEAVLGYGGGSPSNLPATGTLQVTGGTIAATRLSVGREGRGEATQSGGQADFQILQIGVTSGAATAESPNSYILTAGSLSSGVLAVGENGNGAFIQTGGHFAASGTTIIRTFGETARFELRGGEYSVSRQMLGYDMNPDAQRRYRGDFIQTGGSHTVDFFKIGPNGQFQYTGGSFRVAELLESRGRIDFGGSAVTLEVGDLAFVDFARSVLSNSTQASIVAGKDSLLNFPAGFDPHASFASIQTQGLIHIDGQPLAIPANSSIHGSGTITGDVSNSGVISPGHSPGQLVIVGDYAQGSAGALHIEIAGKAEDQFDTLVVTEDAVLNGQLTITLLDDFVPLPTDTFIILTANALNGQFTNAGNNVVFDGGQFEVIYSPTSVTLTGFTVVPEPSCLGVLALLPLLTRRRRLVG